MQKDGAAAPLPARPEIIVQNENKVVETVVAPQFLATVPAGKRHGSVIDRGTRIIAPAIGFADRAQWPRCERTRTRWAEKSAQQPKFSHRRRAIALALVARQGAFTDGTGKARRPQEETTPRRSIEGEFWHRHDNGAAHALGRAFRMAGLRRGSRRETGLDHRCFVIDQRGIIGCLASSRRIEHSALSDASPRAASPSTRNP